MKWSTFEGLSLFFVDYFATPYQSLKYTVSTVEKRIWIISDDTVSSTETLQRCKILYGNAGQQLCTI